MESSGKLICDQGKRGLSDFYSSSAYDHKREENVAIKKIINVFESKTCMKRTLRELLLLRSLKHDNVI
jgi:serine/threonine protein kinase